MTEQKTIGIFVVETPVHCGVGQDIGIVDQPIQRERYTKYPMIHGSEVKGVFRQYYTGDNKNEIFGPEDKREDGSGGDFASAVSFGDAKVLFFPVKSLKGIYVWITSKDVLDKFSRTLKLANINDISIPNIGAPSDNEIIIFDQSIVVEGKVILEEYMFTPVQTNQQNVNQFVSLIDKIVPNSNNEYKYLNESLKKKICIVSDDVFSDFTEMSTEVITRIKINPDTGVVESGALWTEEYLPTDTILYFPVFASQTKNAGTKLSPEDVLNKVKSVPNYIQIGGNETVGKGFVKINWF